MTPEQRSQIARWTVGKILAGDFESSSEILPAMRQEFPEADALDLLAAGIEAMTELAGKFNAATIAPANNSRPN